MSKKISNHIYSLSVGSPPDYEEVIVEIKVDLDPVNNTKIIKYEDGSTIIHRNIDFSLTLQIEEGANKIKIEFSENLKEIHLYLDEFLEAIEQGRKLLLNEK